MDAVLEVPWKYKFHTAKVMADYGSADNNLLPIFKDQHIIVVSKEGDATGWWKGRFGDQVSLFKCVMLKLLSLEKSNIILLKLIYSHVQCWTNYILIRGDACKVVQVFVLQTLNLNMICRTLVIYLYVIFC